MRRVFQHLAALASSGTFAMAAASPWTAPGAAERYVAQALSDNLAFQAQALDVESARARLGAVSGARQPRLDLMARYSRADGGRTIDVPAGDLLNPVYSTLNNLLTAQGRPAPFTPVTNLSIPFLREHEQDTRLRLTAPLYNPQLTRTRAAQESGVTAASLHYAAFRRDVRLAVLSAYYGFLRARAAEQILISAAETTTEALRVSRALLAADKVTEDRVLRAEAEDLGVRQQLADAARDRAGALHALNLLLHRPLDTAVDVPDAAELAAVSSIVATALIPTATVPESREELASLQAVVTQATESEAAARARTRPTLSLVVDGGLQGESYRTGNGAGYAQASLVGEFNLWDGRQQRSDIQLATTQRRQAELRLAIAREQLTLEARAAADELLAARSALPAAERRAAAAERAFQLTSAREREGLANQLAFLDARQAHTAALLNLEITRQRLLIAGARIDRAFAITSFN
jgi:outer membrane protein